MASSAILGVHIVGNGQNAERAFRSVARAAERMQRQVRRVFSLDSSSFTAGLFRAGGAIAGIGSKITAVVSLISLTDMTFQAQVVRAQTGSTLIPFAVILVLYFLMSLAISTGMRWLERRVTRGLDGVRT